MRLKIFSIFCAHLLFSFYCFFFLKLSFVQEWDWFWQHISIKYLLSAPFTNIFYMHSQPPLHNLLYAGLLKFFYPHQDTALKIFHSIASAAIIAISVYLIFELIENKILRIISATAIFLNPAFFLYENYPLYSINSAFLSILSFFFFFKYEKSEKKNLFYLSLFFITITSLLLYRSAFHFLFAFLAVFIVFLSTEKKYFFRIAVLFILTVLPAFMWNLKNYYLYGFFGSSSWLGLNMNKCITSLMTRGEKKFINSSLGLNPAVTQMQHFYNMPYPYQKFGFNKKSNIPFLNDNNWHNINAPEISALYYKETKKIIFNLPRRYLATCLRSFELFSHPSFTYAHLENNKNRLGIYPDVYNNIFYFDNYFIKKIFDIDIYPISFLMPILIFTFAIIYFAQYFKRIIKPDYYYTFLYVATFIFYYFIVTNILEYGENNRFRFTAESMIILIFFVIIDKIFKIRREKK